MPKYKRGDVVWAYFVYEESNQTKLRPAVIIEVFSDSSFTCMITGTDLRGRKKGIWVEKDSDAGKQMNLDKDSFINAERVADLDNIMIAGYKGYCPFIDELEDLIG